MAYPEDYARSLGNLRSASNTEFLKRLSEIQQNAAAPVARKSDIANLILQKARSDFSVGEPSPSASKKEDKSLLDRGKSAALGILDILSRPLYGVAEAVDTAVNEGGNPLEGLWEGISGKEKTSFIDVLQSADERQIKDTLAYKVLSPEQQQAHLEEELKKSKISNVVYGLAGDLVLDPLNLVGVGIAKNIIKTPIKAVDELTNLDEPLQAAESIARQTPAPALPEATQGPLKRPELPMLSSQTEEALSNAQDATSRVDFPRVQLPKGAVSNRRPPVANIEGQQVKADYKATAPLLETLRQQPSFADLKGVFNKDISPKAFQQQQKARVVHDTAPILDQVSKANPAAVAFITGNQPLPLTDIARLQVDFAVEQIQDSIKSAVAQSKYAVFNAPKQANLSNKLTTAARKQVALENAVRNPKSPRFIPKVFSNYINMLKHAENAIIKKGFDEGNDALFPRAGTKPDSPYLRLSDVLDALPIEVARKAILGPDAVLPTTLLRAVAGEKSALDVLRKDQALFEAVTNIDWAPIMTKDYALKVMTASNKLQPAIEDVAKFTDEAKSAVASDTVKADSLEAISQAAKKEFKYEMPEVKGSFYNLVDDIKRIGQPTIIQQVIDRGKYKLAAGVTGGKNAQRAAQRPRIETAKESIKEVVPENTIKEISESVPLASQAADHGIFSHVLSMFNPAYGYKELRPTVLKNISVRRASATTRAHNITQIFNTVPEKEQLDFWDQVRGISLPKPGMEVAVNNLNKIIGNMFGESGLAEHFAGNSAIARAGVNYNDLNKHLKIVGVKDFKFTDSVKDPVTGKKVILTGPEILQNWRDYIPKNPADLRKFVYALTQATENAMVEYSTFANIGALWGRTKPAQDFVKVTDMHPAIDDMYFPKEIVSQIGKVSHGIDQFYQPLTHSETMRLYDSALRTWKSGVTIYAPSHHIRNMIGDMFLAWLDGVSNPIYYTKAAQILTANARRYSDIKPNKLPLRDILGDTREVEIIEEMMGVKQPRIPRGSRVIASVKVGGKSYPIDINQAYQMAFRHGLLPHSNILEDLPGSESLMERLANRYHPDKAGPFRPFGGRVQHAAQQTSESREHYARLAHWLYALEHTKGNSLEDVFQKAANRVRKYHPDGLDLTPTEKKVFRRLMPFYSWTRKAIPLVVEGIFTNPAKIMAYPKISSGIQELQGIDSSVSDPWPEDQLFPDWLTGNAIGPIFDPQSALSKAISRSDEERGYAVVNPGNPATDILEDYANNPIKGIGNMFTPFVKVPAELGFGREYMTGAPIDDRTEYIDKNIPILSTASRLTHGAAGTGLLEGGDLKGKETEPFNLTGLLNYLTGAGIIDTGRYIKGGEFDLKKRIAEAKKQNGS